MSIGGKNLIIIYNGKAMLVSFDKDELARIMRLQEEVEQKKIDPSQRFLQMSF